MVGGVNLGRVRGRFLVAVAGIYRYRVRRGHEEKFVRKIYGWLGEQQPNKETNEEKSR